MGTRNRSRTRSLQPEERLCKRCPIGRTVLVTREEPHGGIEENVCTFYRFEDASIVKRHVFLRRQRSEKKLSALDVGQQAKEFQPMHERCESAFGNEVDHPRCLAGYSERFIP